MSKKSKFWKRFTAQKLLTGVVLVETILIVESLGFYKEDQGFFLRYIPFIVVVNGLSLLPIYGVMKTLRKKDEHASQSLDDYRDEKWMKKVDTKLDLWHKSTIFYYFLLNTIIMLLFAGLFYWF